jgi:hypothetical protein
MIPFVDAHLVRPSLSPTRYVTGVSNARSRSATNGRVSGKIVEATIFSGKEARRRRSRAFIAERFDLPARPIVLSTSTRAPLTS